MKRSLSLSVLDKSRRKVRGRKNQNRSKCFGFFFPYCVTAGERRSLPGHCAHMDHTWIQTLLSKLGKLCGPHGLHVTSWPTYLHWFQLELKPNMGDTFFPCSAAALILLRRCFQSLVRGLLAGPCVLPWRFQLSLRDTSIICQDGFIFNEIFASVLVSQIFNRISTQELARRLARISGYSRVGDARISRYRCSSYWSVDGNTVRGSSGNCGIGDFQFC